jgi:transglutaminase-like putative cysteine protease
VMAVRMPRILKPGEEYAVTSNMFTPSTDQLSGSRGAYPQTISDYYLQLPPDLPANIKQLSRDLTRSARTPYDKVLAIDKYLAQIPYQEKIDSPKNVDGVEYFLFQQKSGFCLYYASAMAVMLRSVGVPTRLAVGYLPGEPGKDVGEYILRDKHYHAWPEVFFSGYGWVDLEATPGGTGSGVTVESPWVSGDAIAQLPQWDVWLNPQPPDFPDLTNDATTGASDQPVPSDGRLFFASQLGWALVIIFTGLLILVVLATPVLLLRSSFYRWLWHVNRDDLVSIAYDKMCHLAAMVGSGPRPQQTPLEFAAVLAAEFPEQAGSFQHIARTYVESKFGRRGKPGLFEEAEILKARCNAFDALLKRLGLAGKITRGRY